LPDINTLDPNLFTPGKFNKFVKNVERRRTYFQQQINKLTLRVQHVKHDFHLRLASWLTSHYDNVILPDFNVEQMNRKKQPQGSDGKKKRRVYGSQTARELLLWSHGQFRQLLEHFGKQNGCKIHLVTEPHTSKSCSLCALLNNKLGGSRSFKCPHCGYRCHRDFNAAINIFLMWAEILLGPLDFIPIPNQQQPKKSRRVVSRQQL
jgi:putative transposase